MMVSKQPRRVLLIAYHFPPIRGSSGVQRTLQFARHLPKYGWEPLVVSVDPRAYPAVGSDLMADVANGMPVVRAFALDSARHLAVRGRYLGVTAFPDRWLTWWPFGVLACLRLIKRYRPKVLWSTFPIATAHLIGLTVRKLTGLPWVADFRDPMVQEAQRLSKIAGPTWRRLEGSIVRNASGCVFVTRGAMLDHAARYPDRSSESWAVIENGYDETAFAGAETRLDPPKRGRGARVRLLHSGILYGNGRDPGPFLQAVARLHRARPGALEVVLRGSGISLSSVHERLAADLEISEVVRVLPPIGYRDAIAEMLDADALIVIQGRVYNRQIPAKAYEYLRAGRPILALTDPAGDTARLLGEWAGVYSARENSVGEIQGALGRLLDDLAAGNLPVRRRDEVRLLSRESRTEELAAVLDAVVGR